MKKFALIILFAIIPFFYACVSREQPDYTTVTSAISAINNGQVWSPPLTDTLLNDTMILHAQWKKVLFRLKFPAAQGSYNVQPGNTQYFILDNQGHISKTFKLDISYPNMVSNVAGNTTNPKNKYYTGNFKLRFVIDSLGINTDTSGIDAVTLTNGRFTAAYQ